MSVIDTVKRTLLEIFVVGTLAVMALLVAILLLLPSLNWSAISKPGRIEKRLAGYATSNWIHRNAGTQSNPLPPTPENLKAGQSDFEEHCAGCHGLEGDGENRFEADFNPPIPKLTGGAQRWSDGELYFIIANGVAMTAMPGFGKNHDPKEIWGIVLWMRHLAQLSPPEKAAIESRTRMTTEQHERMMKESSPEAEDVQRH
ncbi:c-type cytochrome [Candidatus Binatus sp.]|uniref:c-type cytochrome n=1 Tax=Candidatus Binatus sp. TaxID=2811406 RepID=UPI003CC65E9F